MDEKVSSTKNETLEKTGATDEHIFNCQTVNHIILYLSIYLTLCVCVCVSWRAQGPPPVLDALLVMG